MAYRLHSIREGLKCQRKGSDFGGGNDEQEETEGTEGGGSGFEQKETKETKGKPLVSIPNLRCLCYLLFKFLIVGISSITFYRMDLTTA